MTAHKLVAGDRRPDPRHPGEQLHRWRCSCGARGRAWVEEESDNVWRHEMHVQSVARLAEAEATVDSATDVARLLAEAVDRLRAAEAAAALAGDDVRQVAERRLAPGVDDMDVLDDPEYAAALGRYRRLGDLVVLAEATVEEWRVSTAP